MPNEFLRLLFCSTLFAAVMCQSTISDADPSEYPYVVKLQLSDNPYVILIPGMVVSQRYILASSSAYRSNDMISYVKVTDQHGTEYPVAKSQTVADFFAYWKICRKFNAVKFPMTATSFSDLSTTVNDATYLLFKNDSNVLKKVAPVSAMSMTDCETSQGDVKAAMGICVDKNPTADFCLFFSDGYSGGSGATKTYMSMPVLAFGSQVQATLSTGSVGSFGCSDGQSSNDQVSLLNSIAYSLADLLAQIPAVDIK